MKPSCTAPVSRPMSAALAPQARARSSAALLALNHSEVPSSCARATVRDGARAAAGGAPRRPAPVGHQIAPTLPVTGSTMPVM